MNKDIALIALNELLDKYERSKSLIGENKVNQTFSIVFYSESSKAHTAGERLFPRYFGGLDYEYKQECNETFRELESLGFCRVVFQGDDIVKVSLLLDCLGDIYRFAGRNCSLDVEGECLAFVDRWLLGNADCPVANRYLTAIKERLIQHKSCKSFFSDLDDLSITLRCVEAIERNKREIFLRNLSKHALHHSKIIEGLESRLLTIFNTYGDEAFPEFNALLAHYSINRVAPSVMLKGKIVLSIHGQRFDLGMLGSEFILTKVMLDDCVIVGCLAKRVITIENQTTFFDYEDEDAIVVYLAGYASGTRIQLLKQLYQQYPSLDYYHFGDIDWGGFQIYLHLCRSTGIPFLPLYMDEGTLLKYQKECSELNQQDIKNLNALLVSGPGPFESLIQLMLKMNIKLEQESLSNDI